MSGTAAGLSLDCPADLSMECWKVPGYQYVSYDNSADTPCGVSRIGGTAAGVCDTPAVRVTSWLINGVNVLPAPTGDGWDGCANAWLSDFANTLNTWDPFGGNWQVTISETCAYFVRSRALPATGIQYGRLTAVDTATNQTLTFDPATVRVPDQYYRRIVQVNCDGSTSERWTDSTGAVVAAPPLERMIQCIAEIVPAARPIPTKRLRPRGKRFTGTAAFTAYDGADSVQSVTLRVVTGPVRVRAAGTGGPPPTAWSDDFTVPTGTVLTWEVGNDAHAQLDGSLIFNGTAATSDFVVAWTESLPTDSD